jgi:hypothetical protein
MSIPLKSVQHFASILLFPEYTSVKIIPVKVSLLFFSIVNKSTLNSFLCFQFAQLQID